MVEYTVEEPFGNYTTNIIMTTAHGNTTDKEMVHQPTREVIQYINGLIIILGFITNTLILVILARKKIGSQTTRIILMFLAVTDLSVMFVELFIHFIPFYLRWFQVFSTDLSCGIAFTMQASVITASSWYIMLMTIERFTVVWIPMKAKIICTQRKILVACIAIPIVSLLCYCHLIPDIAAEPDETGYVKCSPKEHHTEGQNRMQFKTKILIWIIMYFFVPAFFIVLLNAAIVFKLAKAHQIQKSMRTSTKRVPPPSKTKLSAMSIRKRISRSLLRSSSSVSSSSSSIRKATTLVIAASITFVILMIPRGVSTTASLDAKWDYSSQQAYILDNSAYLLQYLNHAINFFLYVLANNKFRGELKRMFSCGKGRSESQQQRMMPSSVETEISQMTYVSPSSRYTDSSQPPEMDINENSQLVVFEK